MNLKEIYRNTPFDFPDEWPIFQRISFVISYLLGHTSPMMEKSVFEFRINLMKCYIELLKCIVLLETP